MEDFLANRVAARPSGGLEWIGIDGCFVSEHARDRTYWSRHTDFLPCNRTGRFVKVLRQVWNPPPVVMATSTSCQSRLTSIQPDRRTKTLWLCPSTEAISTTAKIGMDGCHPSAASQGTELPATGS